LSPPFQEETYSVSTLCEEVRDLLQQAYTEVWVVGEVNRVRDHRSGHFYFELIEKGADDQITAKLEAVAWRHDYRRIRQVLDDSDQKITEGQEIRCRGRLDFYPPFGRLQFVVREVDPVFSLGLMARRRQETLAALAKAGLLDRNRSLRLAELPLRVGLVTSHESAAYHDFLSSLRESGYGFEVLFVHAAVQGRGAEKEIVSALSWLHQGRIDCLVMIRGGGSRSDLAVFDSRRVAEAIAEFPAPVLTGLGHEIDQAIADLTAHSAFKTPTKVAEFLVERVADAERSVEALGRSLSHVSMETLRRGREMLGRSERGLLMARHRVASSRSDLAHLAQRFPRAAHFLLDSHRRRVGAVPQRLSAASYRPIERRRQQPVRLVERITAKSQLRLRELAVKLTGWERLCVQLAPERTLERGFSITRDSQGRAMTAPDEVAPGERIISQLAGGRLASRVEES
jgi:exodeoxyribonuclease VII large subunit